MLALKRELQAKSTRLAEIVDDAKRAGRSLSRRESAEVARLSQEAAELGARVPKFNPRAAQGWRDNALAGGDETSSVTLRPEERMADWCRDRGRAGAIGLDEPGHLSLGKMVRGAVTGSWADAKDEKRALSESALADGGYLLAPGLASQVIDRVRNNMAVMKLGAQTVPMQSPQLYMARLDSGDPPHWKAEADPIVDSSPEFSRLVFNAHTLPVEIRISAELFDDLSPEATDVIEREISLSLSLELDRACLRGSGIDPEPLGILGQSGVTLTSLGASGAMPNYWDTLVDAVSVVRGYNIEPDGVIWSSRTEQYHEKLKNSIGAYVEPPFGIAQVPRVVSNQIPNNITVGSSSSCSEIYVGRWSDVLVGIRDDMRFNIRVLDQRYIDTLSYAFLCWIRADVQLAHPQAFNVVTGVTAS